MPKIDSYNQPENLDDALYLLATVTNPKIIAGGTDLMPQLNRDPHIENLRNRGPKSWMTEPVQIIDISRIKKLKKIEIGGNKCSIGPLFTHTEIAENRWINKNIPFLANAAGKVGSNQIRNQGTLGGNICNASPCADSVPPLLCLDAEIVLHSNRGERRLPLVSFFVAAQKSIIKKDELLTEISFVIPEGKTIQFFHKIGQRKGSAIAKLNLAFLAKLQAGILQDVRIALGAVAATPILARKTEKFLNSKKLSKNIIAEAKRICSSEARPIDDIRSTAEYRTAMVGEMLEMGLTVYKI